MNQTILSILQNKLRLKGEMHVINIFISLVSTRLNTGSSQPISLPENIKSILTQIVRNKNEVDPRDDSDSKNKLQNKSSTY
jgi:hypothetical protein